jgi:hypothetical protein
VIDDFSIRRWFEAGMGDDQREPPTCLENASHRAKSESEVRNVHQGQATDSFSSMEAFANGTNMNDPAMWILAFDPASAYSSSDIRGLLMAPGLAPAARF